MWISDAPGSPVPDNFRLLGFINDYALQDKSEHFAESFRVWAQVECSFGLDRESIEFMPRAIGPLRDYFDGVRQDITQSLNQAREAVLGIKYEQAEVLSQSAFVPQGYATEMTVVALCAELDRLYNDSVFDKDKNCWVGVTLAHVVRLSEDSPSMKVEVPGGDVEQFLCSEAGFRYLAEIIEEAGQKAQAIDAATQRTPQQESDGNGTSTLRHLVVQNHGSIIDAYFKEQEGAGLALGQNGTQNRSDRIDKMFEPTTIKENLTVQQSHREP
jgi:hypothetical protein